MSHPILTAGDSYWLLVTTASLDTNAGWYTNNLGDIGLTGWSLDDESLCCVGLDLRETFAVLGTPIGAIPEPSTAIMAAIGLLLFFFPKGVFRQPPLVSAARRARGRWDQVPGR